MIRDPTGEEPENGADYDGRLRTEFVVWVDVVMVTRPAVSTTTSIHDAAKIMTTRHFRHLPVEQTDGLLGVVDIIDVCRALINAGEG